MSQGGELRVALPLLPEGVCSPLHAALVITCRATSCQVERGSAGAASRGGDLRSEDSVPTSAFVHGLLFAVGIVRLTNNPLSDERRGKDSSIGLWVV